MNTRPREVAYTMQAKVPSRSGETFMYRGRPYPAPAPSSRRVKVSEARRSSPSHLDGNLPPPVKYKPKSPLRPPPCSSTPPRVRTAHESKRTPRHDVDNGKRPRRGSISLPQQYPPAQSQSPSSSQLREILSFCSRGRKRSATLVSTASLRSSNSLSWTYL